MDPTFSTFQPFHDFEWYCRNNFLFPFRNPKLRDVVKWQKKNTPIKNSVESFLIIVIRWIPQLTSKFWILKKFIDTKRSIKNVILQESILNEFMIQLRQYDFYRCVEEMRPVQSQIDTFVIFLSFYSYTTKHSWCGKKRTIKLFHRFSDDLWTVC